MFKSENLFGAKLPSLCFTPKVILSWPNWGISDSCKLNPSVTKPLELTLT